MDRRKPNCWVWSPRSPLCLHPQHSGSLNSALISHQEEEEEEEGAAVLCCTGCEDVITSHSVHSGISIDSGLALQSPGATSTQQPKPAVHPDGGDVSESLMDDRCWQGAGMETQGCVCAYGQREPEGFGPCWPGSPYVYYGVRRNVVVGVEVVEEVAVEDTLEVITENVYTDDLLDPELLQDDLLYPT